MKTNEINWKEYVMADANGIGIYVGTYHKYNNGSLKGEWIDLEAVSDAEEFFDVCRALHSDEEDPEFMFQDYQNFPESFYSESMTVDEVQDILDFIALDENEREMVEDYCELVCSKICSEEISDAKDRCEGKWDSLEDFLSSQADEMLAGFKSCCKYEYDCKGALGIVETLIEYFDYDRYYRNNEQYYHIGSNGYVFRTY